MTIYDENKHPRGQADNAGQFRDKANSGPDGSLAAADATYEEALAAGRRNGASHATDAQLMAMFCDTSLQTLCGAVSPQLVWNGARKNGLSTGALGDLAASAPMEVAELMWA